MTTTKMGTWNIRTMFDTGKTAQVAQEMRNYNISLLGLCETRWLLAGHMRLSSGETVLFSGHTEDSAHHTEGVALMLAPEAQRSLIGWEPVSSRIITAQFATKKDSIKLNIIQSSAQPMMPKRTRKMHSMTSCKPCWMDRKQKTSPF